MKIKEIREALYNLRETKFRLLQEYMENEGEQTESTLAKEKVIEDLKVLLTSKEGVDSLGRLIRSNQEDIQTFKGEKKFLDSQIKKTESFNDFLLNLIDDILVECNMENTKGSLGYSFTRHTSTTTTVDNKMIKEKFYEKAMEAIRNTDIPSDITISLSASVSKLSEGSELPEWYSQSSVGKATFRKPKKADEKEEENEFSYNTFS